MIPLETISACIRRLTLEVPPEKVLPVIEDEYRRLAKNVRVPGFRKGKVPRQEIERRFKGEVEREALQHIIEKSYVEAVEEQKLQPISQPVVEEANLREDRGVTCKLKFEVIPEFEADHYKAISFSDVPEDPVKDTEVEDEILQHRMMHSTLEPLEKERPVAADDYLTIDFEGTIGGVAFEGGSGKNVAIEVGKGRFIDNFEKGLIGFNRGETRSVPVHFPNDYPNEELKGKDVVFRITVQEQKLRKVPELNEDFIRSYTESNSVEDYRAEVRSQVQKSKERNRRNAIKLKIAEHLRNHHSFETPQSLVAREAEQITREMAYRMAMARMPRERMQELLETEREKTVRVAEDRVRLGLIFEKIAEKEKIELTDADLEVEYRRVAEETKRGAESVKAEYEREHWVAALRNRLFQERVYDFLIANGLNRLVAP